jgi:hypothetical protein
MVTNFYNIENKFNYIRYNSLPAFADYVIDHPKQYYDGWGVQIAHDKPIGIDFDNIKSGDTIFVTTEFLPQVIPILNKIDTPYHLITGVGDGTPEKNIIDEILKTKILTWSGNNIPKVDKRFLQIPIGLSELGDKRPNSFTDYVDLHTHKIIPIVATPTGGTHSSRKELQNLLGYNILNMTERISFQDYMYVLCLSKFSCCPRGNGFDTHRLTESILFNSIPIVKTSILDPMHQEMRAIIVTDWSACKNVDSIPVPELNRDVVTLEYWRARLLDHQHSFDER